MAHDLRFEQRLDHVAIGQRLGMQLGELVERRDHVVAEDDVPLQHRLGERHLRRLRSDRLQDRRNTSPDFDRPCRIHQLVAQRADDALAHA